MRQALERHPDSRSGAISDIEVEIAAHPRGLELRYVVHGRIDDLLLQPGNGRARADDLWKHTCFEAFVGAPGEDGYLELNFSPSGDWAAYDFDAYREGMRGADLATPEIAVRQGADRFELTARFDLPLAAPLLLGLSAVIEQIDGRKSYWALNHPPGAPDFHHPDCFMLELPAATG